MAEQWKILTEFPNYSISSDGEILNNVTKKLLSPMKTAGKLKIQLTDKYDRRKIVLVATLVYETFSGVYVGSKNVLRYADGNPYNCQYSNILVISRSDNMKRLKGQVQESYDLDEIYEKIKSCEGYLSDMAQFSAGTLTVIENCETVRYYREGDTWKKVV